MIEQDRLVVSMVKTGNKDSPYIQKKYTVIQVYEKTYKKRYMAKEKKAWATLNKGERKKYKVAMRMVEHVDWDGEVDEHVDVSLSDDRYKLSDICRMVNGGDICDVLPSMHT